jgi:hypothetical protein
LAALRLLFRAVAPARVAATSEPCRLSESKNQSSGQFEGSNMSKPATIESAVCRKIQARRERGLSKYGQGMERTDFTRLQWLQHAQEEAMDLAVYLEKLIQLEDKK